MSKTPRTDAVTNWDTERTLVAELCKQLETELAAARAKIDTAQALLYAAKDREEEYERRIAELEKSRAVVIEECAKVCDAAGYGDQLVPTESLIEMAVMKGATLQAEKLSSAIRALSTTQDAPGAKNEEMK